MKISAWDSNTLIGLISAMDDSAMNAYIHYLSVKPEYQSKGIGKEPVKPATEHYKECLCIILIAYDKEIGEGKTALLITSHITCNSL